MCDDETPLTPAEYLPVPMKVMGEALLREGMISVSQLRLAVVEAQRTGSRLGPAIVKLGYVGEAMLVEFLSRQYGVPVVDIDTVDVPTEVVSLVPREVRERHLILPIGRRGATLMLAMADPSNIFAIDDVKFLTGYNVEVLVASEAQIVVALDRYYVNQPTNLPDPLQGECGGFGSDGNQDEDPVIVTVCTVDAAKLLDHIIADLQLLRKLLRPE